MWNLCRAQCPASVDELTRKKHLHFYTIQLDNEQQIGQRIFSINNKETDLANSKSIIEELLKNSHSKTLNLSQCIQSINIDNFANNDNSSESTIATPPPPSSSPLTPKTELPPTIVPAKEEKSVKKLIPKPFDNQLEPINPAESNNTSIDTEFNQLSIINPLHSEYNDYSPNIVHEQPNHINILIILLITELNAEQIKMENNLRSKRDSTYLTEYKQQFKWNHPTMMAPSPDPKPEPLITQYQLAYDAMNHSGRADGRGNKFYDITDSALMATSVTNYNNRIPTPGGAVRYRTNNSADESVSCSKLDFDSPVAMEPRRALSTSLFDFEPDSNRSTSPYDQNKSEYHSKFKNFNNYVYVEGDGFKNGNCLNEQMQKMAQSWHSEVKERNKQACKYRARSRNGATPVNPDYEWNGVTVRDLDLRALALATQKLIEDKKLESKFKETKRSHSAKPLSRLSTMPASIGITCSSFGPSSMQMVFNSAPSSLQDDRSSTSSVTKMVRPIKKLIINKPKKPTPIIVNDINIEVDKNNNRTGLQANIDGSNKIWIKPVKKNAESLVNGDLVQTKLVNTDLINDRINSENFETIDKKFDPEPKLAPLHTTEIKSPEEIAGIKSPLPENWQVTIEKGGLHLLNKPVNFNDDKSILINN